MENCIKWWNWRFAKKLLVNVILSGTRRHRTVLSGQGTILSWQFKGKDFDNSYDDTFKITKYPFATEQGNSWELCIAFNVILGFWICCWKSQRAMLWGAAVWLTLIPFEQTNKRKSGKGPQALQSSIHQASMDRWTQTKALQLDLTQRYLELGSEHLRGWWKKLSYANDKSGVERCLRRSSQFWIGWWKIKGMGIGDMI